MNVLNGSKLHLARKSDSRYAVCRRIPIHGALNQEQFQTMIDSLGADHEGFCKTCARKFKELS